MTLGLYADQAYLLDRAALSQQSGLYEFRYRRCHHRHKTLPPPSLCKIAATSVTCQYNADHACTAPCSSGFRLQGIIQKSTKKRTDILPDFLVQARLTLGCFGRRAVKREMKKRTIGKTREKKFWVQRKEKRQKKKKKIQEMVKFTEKSEFCPKRRCGLPLISCDSKIRI